MTKLTAKLNETEKLLEETNRKFNQTGKEAEKTKSLEIDMVKKESKLSEV